MFAVTHGLHDAAAGVIHDKADAAREVDAHVERRLIEYVIRGAHPAEYRRSEAHADDGEQYARDNVESDVRMYRKLHLVVLARAVVARYRNARARGDAGEKADQQEHERTRGADGGERVVAEHVADYQRISRVVQLLENDACKERYRQAHKLPRDGAFRHSVLYVIHCLPLIWDSNIVNIYSSTIENKNQYHQAGRQISLRGTAEDPEKAQAVRPVL